MLLVSVLAVLLTLNTPKDPIPKSVPVSLNKSVMLQLVNKVRQSGCQCGDTYYYPVAPVKWNIQLEAAAYSHSADMYSKGYFSHAAPNGVRGGERIEREGYNWAAFGENIGTGYKTEKAVVEGWLQSPSHCKNIMNKQYKEMGVARVGTLWTQAFASPLSR